MLGLGEIHTTKRRVAIYIRVSTEEQGRDGYSLEAQEKRLREHITENKTLNLEFKGIHIDRHTGSELNRPELMKLREAVKQKKYDAVLVWKIDRLSRNLQHLLVLFEEFKSNNVSFISLQENIDFKGPIGNLIFQIFGAIAQFERELIKGRTMMGKLASADLGNYTGTSIPFGYKPETNISGRGKKLNIVPEEQKWVEKMYEWYIYDALGDGQIAQKLNSLKVPRSKYIKIGDRTWERRPTAVKWTAKMVNFIVTNTIYRGEFLASMKDEQGNELPQVEWKFVKVPKSVSEFTFQQAQSIRSNRVHKGRYTDYLLSGKMYDMTLDRPKAFTGAKRNKGGFSYRRSQFNKNGKHIPVFEVPGLVMEEYAWGKIMEALKNPEEFINYHLNAQYTDVTKISKLEHELDNLREREINAHASMGKIEQFGEEGIYSSERMATKIREKEKEIIKIEEQIKRLEDEVQFIGSLDIEIKKLKDASKQVKHRIDKLDRRGKKILCNLFIDKIEMRRTPVVDQGKNKWKVEPTLYLRFNVEKLVEAAQTDRTTFTQPQAKSGPKTKKSSVDGGPGWI